MRRPPWWLAALAAAAVVFAGGAFVALQSPPGYVHPDEQSAAIPAQRLAGTAAELPPELVPLGRFFVPHGAMVRETSSGVSTGFFAASGIGFGYPLLLAPFYLLGPQAPYLAGALALALLYLGTLLVLDARRPASYALAALVLAIPPLWVHVGLLFSNLPGLGFAVLGLGLVAEGWRSGRAWPVAPGLLSVAVAAALRIDYLVAFLLMLPLVLVALLPVAAPGRRVRVAAQWGLGVALCLAAGLLAFRFVNGTWGVPYLHTAHGEATTDVETVGSVLERALGIWNTTQSHTDPARPAQTAESYLFGFVPFLAAAGLVYVARPSGRASPAWVLLPLMAQGLLVWLSTAGVRHYGTGCACLDASQPRYFMPIYVSLAILAALALRDALDRVRPRLARGGLAVALAALVVVPAVAHAHEGEQGIGWLRERKEWHEGFDEAVSRLPADAVVAGNYLSKVADSRPVLVPSRTNNFPRLVANVTYAGHPVYVSALWIGPAGDEGWRYGRQLVASNRHYLMKADAGDFFEVRPTNATVGNVYDLHRGDWEDLPDRSALNATAERARFRIVERPNASLPLEGPMRVPGRLLVTWWDDVPGRVVRVGYGDVEANATVDLAASPGTGRGRWVTTEVPLPRGTPIEGELYVTGKPTVRRLQVVWG